METQTHSAIRVLLQRIRSIPLSVPYRRARYEPGDVLDLDFRTAWPDVAGRGRFRIEVFAGGGYAGQVYRCRLDSVALEAGDAAAVGLVAGHVYAVKILVPPSRVATRFRDFIYRIGFQSAFSPQTNAAACRTGLLWPKVLRVATQREFGRADAVADTYASFYDDELRAWGEIREWVEGRQWRLESDRRLRLRRRWRTIDPVETDSQEYIAKRQFMARLVAMLGRMGAPELARQYAWWTMKSQPNVLRRDGAGAAPGDGLCAVDFRAGLALLPCLPMSPADFVLIVRGIRRGSWVQFDRCDFGRLRAWFAAEAPDGEPEVGRLLDALEAADREYRAAQADFTHQGWRLLREPALRASVRRGLADGWYCAGLADAAARDRLAAGQGFLPYLLLGGLPFVGRVLRRWLGDAAWRLHLRRLFASWSYLRQAGRVAAAAAGLRWLRAGRISADHAHRVADHPGLYWVERLALSWLPRFVHRIGTDPWLPFRAIAAGWRYLRAFMADAAFREAWLREQIEDGYRAGMLTAAERDATLARITDPYIARYLKSVGVHLATLPATQIVSLIVGGIVAARHYALTGDAGEAGIAFGVTLAIFQFTPISPGSILRGLYVVCVMIRERNWRDYVVAAPLSFVKYIGYLAFPLQMTTAYPELAQFLAGRWATRAVSSVPVFGERGGLFEHMVFDMCFNVTHAAGRWMSRHVRGLLNAWAVFGSCLLVMALARWVEWELVAGLTVEGVTPEGAKALQRLINLLIGYVGIFVLPRMLFYPVLRRRDSRRRA